VNAFCSYVSSILGNLTVTSAYRNNVIIATAAATLSLLPVASATDGFYFVIKNDSASANVTIDPNLAELIDGAATVTVRPKQAAICICNGTAWKTLFLDSMNIFADSIQTSGSSGVVLKNSAGTTAATFGVSATTNGSIVGGLTVGGTLSAVGTLAVAGNSTAAAVLTLAEDTDNGTNKVTITPPQTIASDYTLTLPSATGTIALTSDIPSGFTSADQTITAAGSLTIAHGLSSTPTEWHVSLICQSADLGYSANDIVPYSLGGQGNVSATSNSGIMMRPDATNLNIRFGQSVSPSTIFLLHNTTGVLTGIDNTKWKARFKVKV